MSYGPHTRPLKSDKRAGVELPCAVPDCSETVLATLDTETVEATREVGQIVRVSTPETAIDKWAYSPEHTDVYREAVHEDHPEVDALRVLDDAESTERDTAGDAEESQ